MTISPSPSQISAPRDTGTGVLAAVLTEPDRYGDGIVVVRPMWSGVDKMEGLGIAVPRDIAPRLVAAIRAKVVFLGTRVTRNVVGQTYVRADRITVSGRTLEADLERLGF